MAAKIEIIEVQGRKLRRSFIALPYRLARDYPNWVLPFRLQVAELMDPKKHPLFEHSEAVFFVAQRDGKTVGRIAAIEDREHNRSHDERTLHFGLFECEDDLIVAKALFDRVEAEAARRNLSVVRGPFNLSVHDEIGMQISGFDRQNYVMVPGNPDYYRALVEAQGYCKSVDLYCYGLDLDKMHPRVAAMSPKIAKRYGVQVRPVTKAGFATDIENMRRVYNEAWKDNWPWRGATEAEFEHIATSMKQVADLDFVLIAEDQAGEMIGFSLAIPNVNEAMAANRTGRLFPFGLLRLLLGVRKGRRKTWRVVAMGVVEAWRNKGVDVIFHDVQRNIALAEGATHVELSQVLDTNEKMVRTAALVDAEVRMTHRIFEKA